MIGIVAVAALAASVAGVLPGVAITATCRRTRSATSAGRRSYWPSSHWYSTVTFRPSMEPVSLRPLRNAAALRALASADPSRINPTAGSAGCCARAAIGHVAAAPPSSLINSRRLMCPPSGRDGGHNLPQGAVRYVKWITLGAPEEELRRLDQ